MNLKNYTSGVPVWRTIARIEEVLAGAGVAAIQKEYAPGAPGRLAALSFSVELHDKRHVKIRLPADTDAVYDTLRKQCKRPHRGTLERLREQADRTAWKLMQDWVEVQISLIQLQKVDFLQVFLSYVWDGKQTFYTALKDSGYRNLLVEKT